VYYCSNCRAVNDTQPEDTGKAIQPVATDDPDAVPVDVVRLHAPYHLVTAPTRPSDPAEKAPDPVPESASLPTDACDRVVVVEDASDGDYLRMWMEKILAPEQWETISAEAIFLYTGGRPTGDEVNQRLDTIKRLHRDRPNLQPKAFVVADRDYRFDEEIQTERQKLSQKAFARQTWHVWQDRVEIEGYLLCPDAIVRYVMDLVNRAPADPRFPPPSEVEVKALLEEAVEASRDAARYQLIDSFARVKKGQPASQSTRDAEAFLNARWQGDGRLEWCDAKEVVLPRLKGECKRWWNVAFSERELIRSLRPEEIPAEVARLVGDLVSFLGQSDWMRLETAERKAVRPLIDALRNKDPGVRRAAADSLRAHGRAGVVALARALKDSDVEVRRTAADSLVWIGNQAGRAVPALTAALADEDPEVRRAATVALGSIGTTARAAVPELVQLLGKDSVPVVRARAAGALGLIGETGAAVPALVSALSDGDAEVRSAVAAALGQLGPAAAAAVPELLVALADTRAGYEVVRQQAAVALGKLGQATPDVLQALTGGLADPHRDRRRFAVRALGDLGPQAESAVTALVTLMGDEDMFVRQDLAEALGKIECPIAQVVTALVRQAGDTDWQVRRAAAEALGRLGPPAADAIGVLENLANEDISGLVRVGADLALMRIRGDAERSVQRLCEQLRASDVSVRLAAAEALRAIGPAAAVALPARAQALGDKHWNVRAVAAATIGDLGSGAVSATGALATAFADDYVEDSSGGRLIGQVTWEDGPTYDLVRVLAAVALGKIGPPAAAALPVLRAAARFRKVVREAAEEAVRQIEQPE
jgi:HEAT repeat protein